MNTDDLKTLGSNWPKVTLENSSLKTDIERLKTLNYFNSIEFDNNDSQSIADFAKANNMEYLQKKLGNDYVTYKQGWVYQPAWIGNNDTPLLTNIVYGELLGYKVEFSVELIADTLVMGKVKPTQQGIVRVKLPKLFPQVLLDSNKNDQGMLSNVAVSYQADQRLGLEGDFSNYFDFYSPMGLQVNTLSLLAPNFMQILVDSAPYVDVEFYGNEMILMTKEPLFTTKVMNAVYSALETQLTYLDRLTNSWDYVPKEPPLDLLKRSTVSSNVLKVGNFRLNLGIIIMIIFAILFFVILLLPES